MRQTESIACLFHAPTETLIVRSRRRKQADPCKLPTPSREPENTFLDFQRLRHFGFMVPMRVQSWRWRLSMNCPAKPKLKNSKTLISEFMSFGLSCRRNRKMPFLISHDLGISGSWSQCASDGWRWMLPMNREAGLGGVGRLDLLPADTHWSHGPTVGFLSPTGGEDQGEEARFMGRVRERVNVNSN